MIDPRKFWTMCRLHDWYYSYSDDHSVYEAGAASHDDLLAIAKKSDEHWRIYQDWHDYHFNSGAKPEEPKLDEPHEAQ